MLTADLLDAFVPEVERLIGDGTITGRDRIAAEKLVRDAEKWDGEDEEGDGLVEEAFDILNNAAPPYVYFGAHEGDGADYGWWPALDSLLEDLRTGNNVEPFSEMPPHYTGLAADVNERGNVELYEVVNGHVKRTLWGVV